jgi:aspartate carbamoyltransferase catalytic subunit
MTLQAMGADAVIIRHPASGAAQRLADSHWMSGSVVNAGDGTHEHPSQALLDAFTIRKHLGMGGSDLSGLSVAIVGDILHSRVARSNVLLLTMLGAKVTLVAPPTLLPVGIDKWPATVSYDFDSVIPHVDVVMMLRVQQERMSDLFFPNAREYSRYFGLNVERMSNMKKGAIVMHPGPMNRGLEISAEVADSARSVITEQVTNGVSVRMSILYVLLAGGALEVGSN